MGPLVVAALAAMLTTDASTKARETRPTSRVGAPGAPRVDTPRPSPLGLRFEANVGQSDPSVRFIARYGRATALLTSDAIVLPAPAGPAKATKAERRALVDGRSKPREYRAPVTVRLPGARPNAPMVGEAPLTATITHVRGPSPVGIDVPAFERVRIREAYPGIDVLFHAGPRGIEIDFEVAPGADPSAIAFETADGFERRDDGSLARGSVVLSPPQTYELHADGMRAIVSSWREDATFVLGPRNGDLPLVIDPVLDMATYLGGTGADVPGLSGIALDATGDIYVAGTTTSADLPVTNGAPQATLNGTDDVFVAKITADGKSLVYCTYLGGSDVETYAYLERPIVVDATGAAYVGGQTSSTDFPTTAGAYDRAPHGGYDAYLTKLSRDGRSLVYSTLLGGAGGDHSLGLSVDATGALFVGGWTFSPDFPTTPGSIATLSRAFVTKLAPSGGSLEYSTYVGGTTTVGFSLVAKNGIATLLGDTRDTPFPSTPGVFQPTYRGGSFDAVLLQIDGKGTGYRFATYLGGNDLDEAFALDVDDAGNVLVAGNTYSPDFPVTPNAFGKTRGADFDGFIVKLDPKAEKLLYGSYAATLAHDSTSSACFDRAGNAFIGGLSLGALPSKGSCRAAGLGWVQMLDATNVVRWSTLLSDEVMALACGPSRVVGAMSVASPDLATPGAYATTHAGGVEAVVFGLRSGPSGIDCMPCDGPFGAGTSRACTQASMPICNTTGRLSGSCTQCNETDLARCASAEVCDFFSGTCAKCNGDRGSNATAPCLAAATPMCVAGVCVAAEAGVDAGVPIGPNTTPPGADAATGSPEPMPHDETSCGCRAVGAPQPPLAIALAVLATMLAAGRRRGR